MPAAAMATLGLGPGAGAPTSKSKIANRRSEIPLRVLLAKPGHPYHYVVSPNLGLGYLATSLRRHGHAPHVFHGGVHRSGLDAYDGVLRTFRPNVVGLQLFTHELALAPDYVGRARAALGDVWIVLGGPHPSADPGGTLEMTGADFVITGEAEDALPQLLEVLENKPLNSRDLSRVTNLVWREDNEIRRSRQTYPASLDSLGFPSWDLMDPRTYPAAPHGTFARRLPVAPIITSRGCPHTCTFCASSVVSGHRVRMRSADNVVEEMALLATRYGVREVHIEDDNVAHDPEHLAAICDELLKRNLGLMWSCPNGVRLERIDRPLARLMEKAGCYSLAVGIESGSQAILDAMSKGTDLHELEEDLRMIAESTSISLTGFFLMGYPGEQREDIEATIRIALRLPLSKALFAFALPHPGTQLHRIYTQKHGSGPLTWDHLYCQSQVPYFCPNDMTIREVKRLHRSAYRHFYLRPRILMRLLNELRRPAQIRQAARRLVPLVSGTSVRA